MAVTAEFTKLCDQARQHLKRREFEPAIALYQQALQIDVDQPDAQEALATAFILSGNLESAIEHLILVTRLAPRRASAFVNLGALYNRLGNFNKAVEMCRKAVSIDRKSADGYYNLGIAHKKLNQLPLAVPAYREALRINPKMVTAHQNLGNVFTDMGNMREAASHFNKALEIDPTFEKARIGLERIEQLKAESKASINPFGRLVDLDKVQSLSLDAARFRKLNAEEREDDRRMLHIINLTIGRKAKDLRDQLKTKLAPELTQLEHNIASQADFATTLDQFKPISKMFQDACRMLDTAVKELRSHEKRMLIDPGE